MMVGQDRHQKASHPISRQTPRSSSLELRLLLLLGLQQLLGIPALHEALKHVALPPQNRI